MTEIRTAYSDEDLLGILKLQQENLPVAISAEEALSEGFVTVVHDFQLLKKMNDLSPHIIAVDGNSVVGYCLSMLSVFRNEIPVLVPMFDLFDQLTWRGQSIKTTPYIVMGQVCIAKSHRGRGIFDQLYKAFKKQHQREFEVALTEISERNQRSWRAHLKAGFELLHKYQAENGEKWLVVGLNLR